MSNGFQELSEELVVWEVSQLRRKIEKLEYKLREIEEIIFPMCYAAKDTPKYIEKINTIIKGR